MNRSIAPPLRALHCHGGEKTINDRVNKFDTAPPSLLQVELQDASRHTAACEWATAS
ncbi:MAG TPA: hypothetical protein P5555_09125 [Candidatus Paceibacterota bacterium]|nr:hypothetical protein [Verrucomicrobiota bacterium]HOX03878.1 hypothetical protein [Verrucomicrobiota bacterium]HRZ45337.1 hypothetical protein [Candidatus Paceibacterota bacterium]HRZ94751.1 hypothetical protein [Candidatus Paceibacterota bacterium]